MKLEPNLQRTYHLYKNFKDVKHKIDSYLKSYKLSIGKFKSIKEPHYQNSHTYYRLDVVEINGKRKAFEKLDFDENWEHFTNVNHLVLTQTIPYTNKIPVQHNELY